VVAAADGGGGPAARGAASGATARRRAHAALGDRIAEQAFQLDAALHRLLTDLRAFDAAGYWGDAGAASCASWLAWRVGWDPGTAREHVRVARALGELPRIDAALREGRLSYSKVRAITRVATPATEAALLEDARHTTAEQLELICRKLRAVQAPGRAVGRRRAGAAHGHASAIATSGLAAIEAVLPPVVRRAWGGDRARRRRCGRGGRLSSTTARSLTSPRGRRRASRVPRERRGRAIARALARRDVTCRFPGCTNRRFLAGHHLTHWIHGGATALGNLCRLCPSHHRFVHEHGYRVELRDGEPVFFRRGREVHAEPPRVIDTTRAWAAIRAGNAAMPIDATTGQCAWDGRPVDYARVVGTRRSRPRPDATGRPRRSAGPARRAARGWLSRQASWYVVDRQREVRLGNDVAAGDRDAGQPGVVVGAVVAVMRRSRCETTT
jgi:hypothetical protein